MRKTNALLALILVLALALTFAACDFESLFKNIFENTVWPYSEDGLQEIALNYAAINSEEPNMFVYQWDITVDDGTLDNFSMKYYKDTSGAALVEKFVYQKGDSIKTLLAIGDESYYIDENTMAVFRQSTPLFAALESARLYALEFGIIEATDMSMQPRWTLVSKEDTATAQNYQGENEVFVKYEYSSIEPQSSVKSVSMDVYFVRKIVPMIARIDYSVEQGGSHIADVTVFMIWDNTGASESDFAAPTTSAGYTFEE